MEEEGEEEEEKEEEEEEEEDFLWDLLGVVSGLGRRPPRAVKVVEVMGVFFDDGRPKVEPAEELWLRLSWPERRDRSEGCFCFCGRLEVVVVVEEGWGLGLAAWSLWARPVAGRRDFMGRVCDAEVEEEEEEEVEREEKVGMFERLAVEPLGPAEIMSWARRVPTRALLELRAAPGGCGCRRCVGDVGGVRSSLATATPAAGSTEEPIGVLFAPVAAVVVGEISECTRPGANGDSGDASIVDDELVPNISDERLRLA